MKIGAKTRSTAFLKFSIAKTNVSTKKELRYLIVCDTMQYYTILGGVPCGYDEISCYRSNSDRKEHSCSP